MQRKKQFRYHVLADQLRDEIVTGKIKAGEFLLSESELCKKFEVSRITVRKSLAMLQDEGLVMKKAGQGSLVLPYRPTQNTLRLAVIYPLPYIDYAMPIILKHFRARFPEVEVQILQMHGSEFLELFQHPDIQYQPDIILHGNEFFRTVSTADFMDLSELCKDEHMGSMYPTLLQNKPKSGELYTLPVTFSPVYLTYNPNMFSKYQLPEPELNWTLEDFLATGLALKRDENGDGITDTYGLSFNKSITRWTVLALCAGFNFDFSDSKNLDILEETLSLIHNMLFRNPIINILGTDRDGFEHHSFKEEKVGMLLTTTFAMAETRRKKLAFSPKVASLPFGKFKRTILITHELAIPKKAMQKYWATKFVSVALDPVVQQEIAQTAGYLSVHAHVNEQIWQEDDLIKMNMTRQQMEQNLFVHNIFPNVSNDAVLNEMKLYWAGMHSAKECVEMLKKLVISK